MLDFFTGSAPALWIWVLGVTALGIALAYGVIRSGNLKKGEKVQLDNSTRARQRREDPQKP